MAELKTFCFTDICGSVRLKGEMIGRSVTERDQAFIERILSPHRARIEARLDEFGGRVVSTAGDGHFLVFANTVQAAQWAVGVQETHRDDPIKTPAGDAVEVRISMHVGVPQTDPSDASNFVGKSVDYAARLNDYATGGQILVSRSVMAILDDVGIEDIRLHSHDKKSLRGIGNVDVYELLYDAHGPRNLRSAPKSSGERQWTVIPTAGFEGGSGGAAIASAPTLKKVGNYELEELLGSGGMGDVYKARHTQFGRVRAVKVIKPQFVAAEHNDVIRRFYNEIKAVGRLEHKNIVVAIDSSAPSDKVHYLVMEYIDGVGVDEFVDQLGPLPVPEACEIIRQAARGLQYIYKHDMVHRDIKPSNLMLAVVENDRVQSDSTLTQSGEGGERVVVKILDLGLALLADDGHDRLTRLDQKAMGTGMYMSPEQWRTTTVDIRADIYSLGCTLYHLLAGNPPFFDSDLRPEKAHEKSSVPPIRSGMQPLPKKLWDAIRRMLEKRPADRFATPAEVSAALAPFCEGHQLAALVRSQVAVGPRPTSAGETIGNAASRGDTWRSKSKPDRAASSESRQRLISAAGKATVILAAIGLVLWLFYRSKQEYVADALEVARRSLPAFARQAAGDGGKLAADIAIRFKSLTELAAEQDLRTMLTKLREAPDDPESGGALDRWIGTLTHDTGINVESWFVTDAEGRQIARSPRSDTIGNSYNKRDYFHGLGRDLTNADEIAKARPIRAPHLSTVYKSDDTGKLKVAFSVPIWGAAATAVNDARVTDKAAPKATAADEQAVAEREVLGVLAMSVNVADFEVLGSEYQGGNDVVLIDLRPDQIDGSPQLGLILHHPRQKPGEPARVDPKLLAEIEKSNPNDPKFRSEDHFLVGYRDPFDPGRRYWGAFQPVVIKVAPATPKEVDRPADRPQWIVLVQKQAVE